MRIRIRGPAGQSVITLADTVTVTELRAKIIETTSIKSFDLKYGYPPQPLELDGFPASSVISEVGVRLNGEQLIVSEKAERTAGKSANEESQNHGGSNNSGSAPDAGQPKTTDLSASSLTNIQDAPLRSTAKRPPVPQPSESRSTDAPELPFPSYSSTLLLRIMPDDNSCLFRAFGSAFFGALDNMHELRSIIAQNIQAHPSTYPRVVLEKDPDDYCRWIQTEDAWGGAIELDILSRHFEIEICSIDVQTLRVDRFNEGRPTRCVLVYSGVHYDVIALSPSDPPYDRAYAPPDFDTKVFSAGDGAVLEKAVELCRVLQEQHYFTDTAGFSVSCNICGGLFKGERGATEHARQTGHYDFGEAN